MADTVTLTRSEYDELLEHIEDLEASVALMRAQQEDDGTRIPLEVVEAEVNGDHPVSAWRKHCGLTVRELAQQAGISLAYLSEITNGHKPGSVAAYRALAQALGVPVDVLILDDAATRPG